MSEYQILLFYKYVKITDPEAVKNWQIQLCTKLNLKSRIIVAHEGINGTLEGTVQSTETYIQEMEKDERFRGISYKKSMGVGNAFPKISVKVRPEIVSLHLGPEDFSPNYLTGKYITADELHQWFTQGKEFYIIDMRNDYEHKVGYFKNSILPNLKNFRDLPNVLNSIEHLKDKTVVTVCTGGVRCEKASGFLIKKGFKDVYQLKDGIVTYMEKYPNQHFLGKLYVFDRRIVMGFNVDDPKHVVVGKCDKCGSSSDNYVDCKYLHCKNNRHFIVCLRCLETSFANFFCCDDCFQKFSLDPKNNEFKPY